MVKLIENDEHFILVSLLITVCMQMSFFAIAYTLQIDKVTDFAGTANFLVLAVFTIWLGGDFSFPKILDRPFVAVKTPPFGSAMSCP